MSNTAVHFRLRPEVRAKLARLNRSQNDLARHLRISSGYMSQLLSGKRNVGPAVRTRFLRLLPRARFDDLFEEVKR